MKKRTKEILDLLDQEYGTEYKCFLQGVCIDYAGREKIKRAEKKAERA